MYNTILIYHSSSAETQKQVNQTQLGSADAFYSVTNIMHTKDRQIQY